MNTMTNTARAISLLILCTLLPVSALAQTAKADKVFGYPGAGVLQAGDLWESFLPENSTVGYYSELSPAATLGRRTLVRMGNFDRQWSTPNSNWPNAYWMDVFWSKEMMVFVHDTSATFNPATIDGAANPSYFGVDKAAEGQFSNYAQLTYKPSVVGAGDVARNYTIDPYFTDARRQHAVYESAWPTNVGIDVKFRAHSFAAPNWGNLNDFVIIEVTLKNTGVLDMNMDGVPEKTGNKIVALDSWFGAQSYMTISNYKTGGRASGLAATPIARQTAYIADADATGSPWDFVAVYPSATVYNPTKGQGAVDIGFNYVADKSYTDTWYGWTTIDVKKGGMPNDVTASVASSPSKPTIFGTHPIGVGTERGWYKGAMTTRLGSTMTSPRDMFLTCMGQWFTDGGKSIPTSRNLYDLSPNTNFFSAGTTGNIFSFVPKTNGAGMPNGDSKMTGVFDQVPFEDGSADASTKYPAGYGKFSKGATHMENFDSELYEATGPFSLDVGESITIVLATVAGYRLEGIQRAVEAARFAFAQNLNVPKTPALPKVLVKNTAKPTISVEWDNAAESDPQFAGYKIYKSTQSKKKSFLDEGMRVVDRYQEQMTPGTIPSELKKPVNPKFDAFTAVSGAPLQGTYQPDTWGTWDLVKTLTKADISSFTVRSNPGTTTTKGYSYIFDDTATVLGNSYWYYVAAYKEDPAEYAGPGGQTTPRIETHSTNRNGANGMWNLTYPFATANANFPLPTDAAAYQAMGAVQILALPTGVVEHTDAVPDQFRVYQNYPNPFNPSTSITFAIPSRQYVSLTIFDVMGREDAVLVAGELHAGTYTRQWNASGVPSGVYFYRLQAGAYAETKRLLLLK